MNKLILSFAIIVAGLSIGYGLQLLTAQGRIRLPLSIDRLRLGLQKAALLFFMPVTVFAAIWTTHLSSARVAALPLFGAGAIILGGALALSAARLLRLGPAQTGSFFVCGAFTNIGSVGALVCYLFLGESGFALVPVYKLFEELTYYGVGFPIAKYFSTRSDIQAGGGKRIRAMARDPFILTALSAIVLGSLMNVSNIPRPAFFQTINAVFIPLGTGMLLISIGLAMKFKHVGAYVKPCLTVAIIKFVCVPAAMGTLAMLAGYGQIDNGLPLKVVLILSSMPVAFNALIPPSIYRLDLDLANACWFFSTAALLLVLPILHAVFI